AEGQVRPYGFFEGVQEFAVGVVKADGPVVSGGDGLAVGTPGSPDSGHLGNFCLRFHIEEPGTPRELVAGRPDDSLAVGGEGEAAITVIPAGADLERRIIRG